jgi:glycosyltransferase involved in cell wall biosynthesis
MRILILNYEFPPLGGGAGNATYYLLKEFSKETAFSIDLVTSAVGAYREEKFSQNVTIYYLDIGKRENIHYQTNKDLVLYTYKSFRLAKKLINLRQYDLIHAFFGIPCGFVAMLIGLPYIVSLRGSDVPLYNPRYQLLDRVIFRHISKLVWKKARAVVANSEGLKKLALKTSPDQKIEVVYNGVDTEEFYPGKGVNTKRFVVLSTSRLIERKGIEYLIRGFAKFSKDRREKTKLILAGSGDQEGYLRGLVGQLGIDMLVEFRGPVEHDKMADIYREADVFVLPSLNEGMSNSLLEAMASGLPVIVTGTGGTRELVTEKNGIIIDKNSAEAIFKALEVLYSKTNLRSKMRNMSRESAEGLSWENTAAKYFRLYKEIKDQDD